MSGGAFGTQGPPRLMMGCRHPADLMPPGRAAPERAREHQEHSGRGGGGRPVTEAHPAATDMVGARPRQSNAAHDAGIDGKGVGSRERDPPGWVNIHGHVHQQDSPSSNRHINVSVEQLNYQPVRLSDIRRLARRLMEGRTVPGPSTRARLNIVEIAMP